MVTLEPLFTINSSARIGPDLMSWHAFRGWKRHVAVVLASLELALGMTGCRSQPEPVFHGTDYQPFATEIEYPDASDSCVVQASAHSKLPPHGLSEPVSEETWELTLDEAIFMALQNSKVMREVGVRIVSSPQSMTTVYDPAMQQVNPQNGEEAALSAFDAQFATSLFLDQDDRSFNNPLFAGAGFASGAASLTTETGVFDAAITKRAATGTQFSVSNNTTRTSRNSAFELFPSYYETTFSAEFRHPLLQGGGIGFNRIAGPNSTPGNYNGIVLARIRTDVALVDFENAVRTLVEDVQQTYWQLYFAYRNLDARIAARDAALESWRTEKTKLVEGASIILDEALTREQYYEFQSQVAEALSGTGSDTALRQTGLGVYTTERRLRLLLGLDVNDGRLIRPADEPSRAEVIFDWEEAVDNAMFRRLELRRQNWIVKQRELELLAARNHTMMRLDLVGQYRWRGFGDELLGERGRENGSAFRDLFQGELQGSQIGLQLSTPIGNRIGHAAARNAELALVRERALLQEQERYVYGELSDAYAELQRAYTQTKNSFNRIIAARQRLDAQMARYEVDRLLQFVLDAQSRVAEAEANYYQSIVDYNLAVAKMHYTQGTLLDYFGVRLSEGAWTEAAHNSAAKNMRRFKPRLMNYCITQPCPVSNGRYEQEVLPRPLDGEVIPITDTPKGEPTEAEPMNFEPAPMPAELDEATSVDSF